MHPWIEGDKQGAAAFWGWAWRCCHSGRQEGLVQGERWGKGLAAASGCGIHPHIDSVTIKQPKPVPAQSTAETAQHCPALPSGAAPHDGENSLGLLESDGTAPSLPVTLWLFPHKLENPTGSEPNQQVKKQERSRTVRSPNPHIHTGCRDSVQKPVRQGRFCPSPPFSHDINTPLISPPGTTQLSILKTQTGLNLQLCVG